MCKPCPGHIQLVLWATAASVVSQADVPVYVRLYQNNASTRSEQWTQKHGRHGGLQSNMQNHSLLFPGKSKEAEIKRINKELANIRSKFKGESGTVICALSRTKALVLLMLFVFSLSTHLLCGSQLCFCSVRSGFQWRLMCLAKVCTPPCERDSLSSARVSCTLPSAPRCL